MKRLMTVNKGKRYVRFVATGSPLTMHTPMGERRKIDSFD